MHSVFLFLPCCGKERERGLRLDKMFSLHAALLLCCCWVFFVSAIVNFWVPRYGIVVYRYFFQYTTVDERVGGRIGYKAGSVNGCASSMCGWNREVNTMSFVILPGGVSSKENIFRGSNYVCAIACRWALFSLSMRSRLNKYGKLHYCCHYC